MGSLIIRLLQLKRCVHVFLFFLFCFILFQFFVAFRCETIFIDILYLTMLVILNSSPNFWFRFLATFASSIEIKTLCWLAIVVQRKCFWKKSLRSEKWSFPSVQRMWQTSKVRTKISLKETYENMFPPLLVLQS